MSSLRSLRGARKGPTRTTEKSEAPPPMSATSTFSWRCTPCLVVERRRNRLSRKPARHAARRRLGQGIAGRVVVDEEDGPAEHGARDRRPRFGFGAAFQVLEIGRDDVEIADGAAVRRCRSSVR
jgi:hypothetical protein